MNVDLTLFPQTLDVLHLIFAGTTALLAIGLATRGRRTPVAPLPPMEETPVPLVQPAAETSPSLRQTSPDAALQLLALLQQEARLVDFLQEDVKAFSDAEVGAAARVVHEGARRVLHDYVALAPVHSAAEESRVVVPAGFDPRQIRLTGQVVGQAPYTGTLVHRGWQVTDVRLPQVSEGHDLRVLMPAEVEL